MKTANMQVTYVDHMGSDLTVVNAARVSFDKESHLEQQMAVWTERDMELAYAFNGTPMDKSKIGTMVPTGRPYLAEKDVKLIKYLAKHNHWSPFAHTSIQFRIKAPIFVARQLVKHQVGLVWNEVSRRYVDTEPEMFWPMEWRERPDGSIKQGSKGTSEWMYSTDGWPGETNEDCIKDTVAGLVDTYNEMINRGVAPEQARMILPQNTMTEWYWTGSLMAFVRVCKERLDPHAQQECREVAQMIYNHIIKLFPVSVEALFGKEEA